MNPQIPIHFTKPEKPQRLTIHRHRKCAVHRVAHGHAHSPSPLSGSPRPSEHPLPGGEGWGEGGISSPKSDSGEGIKGEGLRGERGEGRGEALPHLILLFAFFAYFVVPLPAATITGNIQDTSGQAYATNALFAPLSTPLAIGNNIIASTPTNVVAAADGSFSVLLKQGNYLVTLGGLRRDSVLISVPNDANTYNLNSLITSALNFNYPYSPIYEQRVNKGQADGYVGLVGTTLSPSGLTASNFNFQGTVNLGTASDNYANFYVNQNSTMYVQPGASLTLAGDSSPRSEMFLHGTNAFIRFDEDAAINDGTSSRVWKFNRFNITSNQVARFGDVTNIVNTKLSSGPSILSFATARATNGTMTVNNLNSTILSIYNSGDIAADVTLTNVSPVANGQFLVLLNSMSYLVQLSGNFPIVSANSTVNGGSGGMFVYSTNNTPAGWIQLGEFPIP